MADDFDRDCFVSLQIRDFLRELDSELNDLFQGEAFGMTSPIEFMLAVALELQMRRLLSEGVGIESVGIGLPNNQINSLVIPPFYGIWIYPQCKVGNYVADFVIAYRIHGEPGMLVVECDGHDYHERTKEQARHDKKRDRAMQVMGLPVFRYTGSEIWKDPTAVAEDILDNIVRLASVVRKT